jgi:hypothetical protein
MMATKKKKPALRETAWPPAAGETVSFWSEGLLYDGVLKEVRWGLVWRDFLLEDGRVIPEHRVVGAPKTPDWRDPLTVPNEERKACEKRLRRMAEAGADPTDREQVFWAELTQYVAHTYLRFGGEVPESMVEVWGRLKKH